MDYNLRDLKFFRTVAEFEHIGRAATALGRSQPAITKCIRRLEDAVGSPLFVREGRGIRLTPVGGLLAQRATQLLSHAGELERELHDFSSGASGHVRIGGGLIAADHVIPDICASILATRPGITFDIVIGQNIVLREELRNGRIDLLVGLIPEGDADFESVALVDDVILPAARHAHPIFQEDRLDLETLTRYPWALPAPSIPSRQWLDLTLSASGNRPLIVQIESNQPSLLPCIIEKADLISFIPSRMIRSHPTHAIRELPVPGLTLRRPFGVTYRRAGYLSPATQRTRDVLVSQGANLFAAGHM
jgi:DNA-binding transcriptional LysR family regulator